MQSGIHRILRLFFLPVCAVSVLLSTVASAEDAWHDHALRIYMGYVENAATINQRDTYQELRMGSEAEAGIGFAIVMNRWFDLEIALSHMSADGTQYNAPGSGNENNRLDIQLKLTRLQMTGKLRYNKKERAFVPWLGGGINASLIDSDEQEYVLVTGGFVRQPEKTRISSALGLHASAGMDIYPVRTSSLALALEVRYQFDAIVNGPFEGDLDGVSLLLGIKWDFWPSTRYRAGS